MTHLNMAHIWAHHLMHRCSLRSDCGAALIFASFADAHVRDSFHFLLPSNFYLPSLCNTTDKKSAPFLHKPGGIWQCKRYRKDRFLVPGHTADFGQKGNGGSASHYMIPSHTESLNWSYLYAGPSAFKETTVTSATEYSCTFAWLPIIVNPKGYCWNGLSKALNIYLRNQLWKLQPVFYLLF